MPGNVSLESDMRGNSPVSFGKGAMEKGCICTTSPAPYFILRGRDGGDTVLLPDADGKGPRNRDLAGGLLHFEGGREKATSLA